MFCRGRGLLVVSASVVALALCVLAAGAAAAPGDLARSFGGNGKVTTELGKRGGEGSAVARYRNGKLVVAGMKVRWRGTETSSGSTAFVIARYRRDGKLDRSFGRGGNGLRTTKFGGNLINLAYDVAVQPDGKIVVAGTTTPVCREECDSSDFAIARYLSDGRLDPSFGNGGKVVTDFGGDDHANSVMLQPDGKVVAVGRSIDFDIGWSWVAIARYLPDGELDPGYGAGGLVQEDFGDRSMSSTDAALLPGGEIVVSGWGRQAQGQEGDGAVARFDDAGALDQSFGDDGLALADFGTGSEGFWAVTTAADGGILAAGESWSEGDMALARFTPAGDLDAAFGDAGTTTTDFGGRDDVAYGLALAGERPVLVGQTLGKQRTRFAVARYRRNGAPDRSFGRAGRVATKFRRDPIIIWPSAADVVVYGSGRIVAAGTASDRIALAKYRP